MLVLFAFLKICIIGVYVCLCYINLEFVITITFISLVVLSTRLACSVFSCDLSNLLLPSLSWPWLSLSVWTYPGYVSWFVTEVAQVLSLMSHMLFSWHLVYISCGTGVFGVFSVGLSRSVTDSLSNFHLWPCTPSSSLLVALIHFLVEVCHLLWFFTAYLIYTTLTNFHHFQVQPQAVPSCFWTSTS